MKLRLINEVDSRMRELERRASSGDYEAQEELSRYRDRTIDNMFQIMLAPGGHYLLARMDSTYEIGAIPVITDIGPLATWPDESSLLYPYVLIGKFSLRISGIVPGAKSSCPIGKCVGFRCALCNNLEFTEQMRTDMTSGELHDKMQNPAYAKRSQQPPMTYAEVEALAKT